MQEIIIRKATLIDLEVLLEFEQGVILAERPFDTTLKDGHIQYYDIPKLITADNSELLVAETAQQIVGSGYARIEVAKPYLKHEQFAYLGFMYVLPTFRGQGINKKIMNGLKKWASEKGMTEFRLSVYVDNQTAIKAYEKVGYTKHMIEMRMNIEVDNSIKNSN